MKDGADLWRRVQRLHPRVLNLLTRVFGLSAVVAALGFMAWGVYFLVHPEAVATHDVVTLSGRAALDFLGVGVFCLALAILFLTVRPFVRISHTAIARARSDGVLGGLGSRDEGAGVSEEQCRFSRRGVLGSTTPTMERVSR